MIDANKDILLAQGATIVVSQRSGYVNVINPLTNASTAFLGGWSLDGLDRLWYLNGSGAILEEPGGLSLWLPLSGGTFTRPPGDFSTLTMPTTTTFQLTEVDGTQVNFTR